ncbi:porphobilinogen synthase [Chlamydia pneumoniae TW-183]|uniref:Delta-aminolevulinic acid dehydratase n=2 Tax=Chlamydia pneumoniae TaxID=83558 RepID=HEM2_CHLPN|nr:porphobilinogen synthase [Chlamydia pneumoniae]Q9Z7G1.1 RecName: Full=Delta-aminolevulinic acid dehydratase; Short=ALAD; Short=ALADH; AltName: Full=Porphobilinogen synthase [Chlamydia pneumoniae]AAD18883.1 Porphobilinogen Synthase [Chlamydia pneumoniae CWL029]AAF37898.1 delta-aminolevulinic acid dehydratase [Chlamydia pneumoniae AR39]AAP98701.1 porphobilinogen synthase [Chlamydia pneumoniae TW-183]CRI33265.1 Delta-aminolevulinic acid dehydratase [Chlamydia pneumoniae]CRI36128.1 Delta-amino
MSSLTLSRRPRRNRKTAAIRDLLAETHLSPKDLIAPFFVKYGNNIKEEIPSLPGVFRWSLDLLLKEIERLCTYGLRAVMLFPIIPDDLKDAYGSYSSNPKNILCHSIHEIKNAFPHLCLISDIALDPYTTHGHDGIFLNGEVLNDESVRIFGNIATLHAEMGADIVAPSDMMDGRIGYIRSKLDQSGYSKTSIMSYSVKYASCLYSPFRDALSSHVTSGDKKQYQMNPKNVLEALLESSLDEEEGADILMVKPAGLYLDVIYRIRQNTCLPLAAYQVSGEYAMILSAFQQGWLDKETLFHESLIAIKRAGADMIISYSAPFILELLHQGFEF